MEAKTVKETLIAARWILENVGWGTEYFAETESGEPLNLGEVKPKIVCACAIGAIYLVEADDIFKWEAETLLSKEVGEYIPTWNDAPGRTKKEVLTAFDKAIEKCE